jgi:hypothetical protein
VGHLASEKLNSKERAEFDARDKRIRENSQKFWGIVSDAKYIRDHHLWRENWKTFEAYIEDAVGMSKAHFYRLLDADDVRAKMVIVANSEPIAMQIRKPSQLLALVGVPDDKLPSVVAAAEGMAGKKPMTAKVLKAAAQKMVPEIVKPKAEQPKLSEKKAEPASATIVWPKDSVEPGQLAVRAMPSDYSHEQQVQWLCETMGVEAVLAIALRNLGTIDDQVDVLSKEHKPVCDRIIDRRLVSEETPAERIRSEFNRGDETVWKELLDESIRLYEQLTKKTAKTKRYSHPTREQVQAYCKERESFVDPDQFFDYYESQGWKKKNGLPIKNWQSAVATWEKSESRDRPKKVDNPVAKTAPVRSKEQWLEDVKKRIAEEADDLKDAPDIAEE